MKRRIPTLLVFSLAAVVLVGPGCAISELKNTNRRLKEANDGLISENNRLQQELAAAETDGADKAKRIDSLQGELDAAKSAPPAQAETPVAANRDPDLDDLEGIQVSRTSKGILLRLDDKVFFPLGQAALSMKGQSSLRKVAARLNSRYRGNLVRVEGHTDDVPVNKVKKQYPSNWELSTARACSVVRYLVDGCKLAPTRIYPAGFAYYKPIASARSASARSQNRRVEILILNERA